jgi:hypothetical protein
LILDSSINDCEINFKNSTKIYGTATIEYSIIDKLFGRCQNAHDTSSQFANGIDNGILGKQISRRGHGFELHIVATGVFEKHCLDNSNMRR